MDDQTQSCWKNVKALDSLTVTVIVDNESDSMSPGCACCDSREGRDPICIYEPELLRLVQAGVAKGVDGSVNIQNMCFAGHGLSLLLEGRVDGKSHFAVFDGGPDPDLWKQNAKKLAIPYSRIEAVILSHWHVDHSSGLEQVVASAQGTGMQQVLVDVHPDRPNARGFMLPHGNLPMNPDPTFQQLTDAGGVLIKRKDEHCLLDEFFYVSGEVPRVTSYETGIPNHGRRLDDGQWQLDPLILDERYVAVNIKGKGPVVFSACSHAGIINVLLDIVNKSGDKPFAVVGGGLGESLSRVLHAMCSGRCLHIRRAEDLNRLADGQETGEDCKDHF
eukprot:jgi/Botrbrau1/3105/Bobra.0070s0087.3